MTESRNAPPPAPGGWIGFCQAMASQRSAPSTSQEMTSGNDNAR